MTLKTIKTHNIQIHRDITIELPERGLIRFSGNNSNGKSVIRKALQDIASHAITAPSKRKSIINKNEMSGEIYLERYDGISLLYHIHREAAQTYAELMIPGEEPIRRYLSDKTIPLLAEKFGIHSEPLEGRSLNIFDSDEALLFFKTSYKLNYSMLMFAYRDHRADVAFNELTQLMKDSKSTRQNLEKSVAISKAELGAIELFNIENELSRATELRRYANVLDGWCALPELLEMKPVPRVKFFVIEPLVLTRIKAPMIMKAYLKVDMNIVDIAREIKTIKEGECPVCHRKFLQ